MISKKVIIIGAGIAGLAAGCYGRINGYDTEIYEMHNVPGGECTSWRRRDYIMDGCIHWLCGTSPKSSFHSMWKEIGALRDTEIVNHDEFFRLEDKNGKTLVMYNNVDKLEKHLIELSPEDEAVVREVTGAIRKLSKMEMPMDKPMEHYNALDWIKMMVKIAPYGGLVAKYSKISVGDFVKRFKSELIRDAFVRVIPAKYIMTSFLMCMSFFNNGDGGYPVGGSLEFASSIEKHYVGLGGKIFYKSKVKSIIVKDGKAVGISLEDGRDAFGDVVISAADGYATIYKMLGGKYISEKINDLYTNKEKYITYTSIQVSLGVDADLSKEPNWIHVKLDEAVEIGGVKTQYIALKNYCYDRTMASPGKSIVVSLIDADYDYWQGIYTDTERYKTEKQRVADIVINTLEKRFPGTKGKVEVTDVATPVTYTRYCNAWRGAYMSWSSTPETGMISVPRTLPGLENFYMGGQWVAPPGGLPGTLMSARQTIQVLCRKDNISFKTSK